MNTPNSWAETDFEVEFTEDGSPSLRQRTSAVDPHQKGESMHHSGGAFAETELIYATPVRKSLSILASPHFVSVGLGLGYVELVIARECELAGKRDFTLDSWESEAVLRNSFIEWIFARPLAPEIRDVYDRVAEFVLRGHALGTASIRRTLQAKYQDHQWRVHGALVHPHPPLDSTGPTRLNLGAGPTEESREAKPRLANGILFDAFSAKTTPELWTEEFLTTYFAENTSENAFVSTYASRTTLKKALTAAGFEIIIRPGFKGKRNSTLAHKGTLSAIFAPVEIS